MHGRLPRHCGSALLVVALIALMTPAASLAGSGVLDPTFGSGGIAKFELGIGDTGSPGSSFAALGFGAAGSIYAAGLSMDDLERWEVLTARLSEDGALDPSFAGSGWVRNLPAAHDNIEFDQYANALSVEANDSVVVAGNMIERFDPSGQFDSGFGPNQPPLEVKAATRLSSGDLLVAGHRTTGEASAPAAVESIRGDGSGDAGFGQGGLAIVPLHQGQSSSMTASSAVQLAGGDVLVSGFGFYVVNGSEASRNFLWLARLTASGALDTSYGEGGVRFVEGFVGKGLLAPRSGGYVLLGSTQIGEQQLFAAWGLNGAGQPDNSFGSDGTSVVPLAPGYNWTRLSAAAVDAHGRVLLVGNEDNTSGQPGHAPERPVLERLDADGQIDGSFGEAGLLLGAPESEFKAVAVDSSGRILVGGEFDEKYGEGRMHRYALLERFVESVTPGATTPAGPIAPGAKRPAPAPLTRTQIAGLLKAAILPRACHASVRELRKRHGCALRVRAGAAGTLLVTWYVSPAVAAHAARSKQRRVAIADGRVKLSQSGAGVVKIRLTRAGLRMLRHTRAALTVSAVASFGVLGQRPIRVTGRSLLHLR
jgi:uncharacterized delta-60 repeat protein